MDLQDLGDVIMWQQCSFTLHAQVSQSYSSQSLPLQAPHQHHVVDITCDWSLPNPMEPCIIEFECALKQGHQKASLVRARFWKTERPPDLLTTLSQKE